MAETLVNQILRQTLDFSYSEIQQEHPEWSKKAVDDYFYKQSNINTLALSGEGVEAQVIINTGNIATNTTNISTNTASIVTNTTNIGTNTTDIGTNTTNIGTNTTDIGTNATNLTNHEADTSAHGVGGVNVGTTDFATTILGGVVLLAANVSDVAATTAAIATADVGAAPVAYDQAYANEQTDLINECKSKINSLVDNDVLDLITQLNAFLAANQTAKQMVP